MNNYRDNGHNARHLQITYNNKSQYSVPVLFQTYERLLINELHIYGEYYNITSSYNNNILFYDTGLSIILNDGSYTLNSINEQLISTLYKVVLSSDGLTYSMLQYNNINDWNTESNHISDTTIIVKDLSELNKQIYNGKIFLDHIYLRVNAIDSIYGNNLQYDNSNDVHPGSILFIPLITKRGLQTIYFNENSWYHNVSLSNIQIQFINPFNNREIKFIDGKYPVLQLILDNHDQ